VKHACATATDGGDLESPELRAADLLQVRLQGARVRHHQGTELPSAACEFRQEHGFEAPQIEIISQEHCASRRIGGVA
jgi:hypothetical protein